MRDLSVMRNINQKKPCKETINILYGKNEEYFYPMWEYDIGRVDLEKHKNQTKLNYRFSGNEIFASCLILILLLIGFGGSHLIKNRTQQQLIYNSILQEDSTIR